MSREIKFRAWNKVDGHMVEADEVFNPYLFRDSEHHELMQSTGLKDRNGVEIYEGDICRVWAKPNFATSDRFPQKKTKVVKWNENTSGWNVRNGVGLQVIGNIYENPELLETA